MSVFPMMKYIHGELMRWFNERLTKGVEECDLVVKSIIKSIEICIKNHAHLYKERRSINAIWEVISRANVEVELWW